MLKLKEINWFYRNVDDDVIDASSKEVIEVVSNTMCKMLEKATEDVKGLQAFTIHKLDTKFVKDSDISQYKLLNVREQAIDDRQLHLDSERIILVKKNLILVNMLNLD